MLPARSRTPIMVETAALRAAVDRITAVCRTALATKASAARLRLSAGELQVSAVTGTPDIEVESTIAVECGSGDVEIGLSARYLAETLAVLDAEQAELHVVASHVNCRVCGAGETENGVLISPMRV